MSGQSCTVFIVRMGSDGFIRSTADTKTTEMETFSLLNYTGSCKQRAGFCEPCFSENFQSDQADECFP